MVEPIPAPARHGVVLIPQTMGLTTADVYAEADHLNQNRGEAELESIRRKLRDAVIEGASPLSYPEHLLNDLQAAAVSLRPEIEAALAALSGAGASHVMVTGSGPTAFGLFPTGAEAAEVAATLAGGLPERACDGSAGPPDGRRARGGGGVRLPLSRRWVFRIVVAALVVAFFVFRDQLPEFDLEEIIKDLSEGLGAWTYLLVALLAFLETGAFVGLVAPGEFTVLLGGAVAGQGDISLPLILAITWLAAFLGRLGQLPAGPPPGPRLPGPARRARADHRGAPEAGRGLLRPPRRQDDPDRPIHRARARPGAVHRRHLEHALPRLLALQRAGDRASGPRPSS